MDEQQFGDLVAGGLFAGLFGLILLCSIGLGVLVIAGMWKVFTKAGKPGWAAIVPIYNVVILLEIAGRPLWWVLLYLIPLANIVFAVILYIDVARSFGQGTGFGLGLMFLSFIFFPILGFGDARYLGPSVRPPLPVS